MKVKHLSVVDAAEYAGVPESTADNMRHVLNEAGLLAKTKYQRQRKTECVAGAFVRSLLTWPEPMMIWFCEEWPDGVSFYEFYNTFIVDAYHDEALR